MSEISVDLKVLSPTRDKAAAHRRAHSQQNSPAYVVSRGLGPKRYDDPADLSLRALVDRHRFLLVAVILLVILCSIYLYFAISMDLRAESARSSCKGLTGEMLRFCEKNLAEPASKS